MSYLKFNHVFFGLMLLAIVSAVILPPRAGQHVQAMFQGVFKPVSWPANRVGMWARAKIAGNIRRDNGSPDHPRTSNEIRIENTELRVALSNLHGQLERMVEREQGLAKLGDLRSLCEPYSVAGADSGPRDSLLLSGSSFSGLREGMPVLYWGGIVGRLSITGASGARVRLLTDVQSKMEASFARLNTKPESPVESQILPGEPALIEGQGNGIMTTRITEKVRNDSGLQKDDSVILNDRDWPAQLNGYRIGYVAAITPTRTPGFLLVTIKPDQKLTELPEVMVMSKEKG